jgi:hypothetical protein
MRVRILSSILWPFLLMAVCVSTAMSQQFTQGTLEEWVAANAQFVLMHELAHVVIQEKRIPVLGPEEMAADYIAAMMLIRPVSVPPAGADKLLRVAINTADAFEIAWRRQSELGQGIPYWSNHALTVQRFSTVACLLFGSDPERFAALPPLLDMPAHRAHGCREEYESAAYAMDWLLTNYARQEGDPPGASFERRFESPPSRASLRMLEAIQDDGFIERTFGVFNELVALDEPATFVMRSCGEPQAAWIPDRRELVFCYELLDAYVLLGQERRGTR